MRDGNVTPPYPHSNIACGQEPKCLTIVLSDGMSVSPRTL